MTAKTPENTLDDVGSVRSYFGEPLHVAVALEKPELDRYHRELIARSPFICVATAASDGQPSVSPKGDAPGFVQVLDDNTLFIPDRPGNNKVLGITNLVENPRLAILFVIPGYAETLRIEGTARVVLDEEILELGKVKGKRPPAALLVHVTKAYAHCGKSMLRSRLWDPSCHVDKGELPTLGKMIKEQGGAPVTLEEADGLVANEYQKNLY